MTVELKSVGNPDFNQDPNKPLYGAEPNKNLKVKNLKEAKEACLKFIEDNDLGSGNWAGGRVYEGKNLIARVSYNGRVWDGEYSLGTSPKEITQLD